MAKLTEYPRATTFDDGDILIKDGINGTKKILVSDAAKVMGSEVIMINETAGSNTKVVVTTTDEDVVLATMDDLDYVSGDVGELRNALYNKIFSLGENYWQRKGLASATGVASNSTTRISTVNYLSDDVGFVSVASGYDFAVFAWDSTDAYQGVWNGSEWVKTGITWLQNEVSLKDLPGGYRYRILVKSHSGTSVTIVLSECVNILFRMLQYTDSTLTTPGSPADAKVTGDKIDRIDNTLSFVSKNNTLLDLGDYETINCAISSSNTYTRSASHYQSKQIPRDELWSYIKVTAGSVLSASVTFVTERIPLAPTQNADMSGILATGETGRHMIATNTSETLLIPADAAYIVIAIKSNDVDETPASVGAYGALQNLLVFDNAPTENSENPVTSGGIYDSVIAKMTYGFTDFIQKNVNSTSGKLTDTDAQNMIVNAELIPTSSVYSIHSNYNNIRFFMYDDAGNFIGGQAAGKTYVSHSDMIQFARNNPTATNLRIRFGLAAYPVSIDPESEHYYANTDNDISLILYKTAGESPETDTSELPSYYDDYLPAVEAKITAVQNSISTNNDAFLFITDYHLSSNRGYSLKMIRHVSRMTGITSLLFSGDAHGGTPTSVSDAERRLRNSTKVWDDLQREVDAFWGALGNHEWITMSYINRSAIFGAYLNRFKLRCGGMNEYGDYWWDNSINKIRYISIQQTSSAAITANQLDWLGDVLSSTPNGSHVLVFAHHGYIPNESSSSEYDGAIISGANYGSESGSHLWAKRVNQILHAYETAGTLTLTISDVAHNYDFTGNTGYVIGVFCGHYHHGTLFGKNDTYNDEHITVFRGSADTLKAATVTTDLGLPWYWEDGTVGGTKVEREAGSAVEQCFYAVQIDLDAKKVYITAVGGDHDWEFEYGD